MGISFGGNNSTHHKDHGPPSSTRRACECSPAQELHSVPSALESESAGDVAESAPGSGKSVGKGQEAGLGPNAQGPRPPVTVGCAQLPGSASRLCPQVACPPHCGGGRLQADRSWGADSSGHGQSQARAQKGNTSCGPEGLGSLRQVRPQPPQSSQGRAKVSRVGAGAGLGPPQRGPARGPAPRVPQKCPFVG